MSRIVVVGGGAVGMIGAVLLARDGHEVTLLERDPAAHTDPADAWEDWQRRGVNQFRMIHLFQPRFTQLLSTEVPEVIEAMEAAGAKRLNIVAEVPDVVSGGPAPGDDRFDGVTARRPVAEAAIAAVAAATGGLTIRRGVAVAGLLHEPGAGGVARVLGVRTMDGDELRADLVVDASGRRSALPSWLAGIGAPPMRVEEEDCGFIYYGRHFRSSDGSTPVLLGPLLMMFDSVSLLTLPADNGTWGIGVITSAEDPAMRGLSKADVWERVVRSFPLAAHWVDGEPIDEGVAVMAKLEDRHRELVVDGAPVVTGLVALADAWACTNPSVGRGISIGAIHAVALRDVLRAGHADPTELVLAFHEATMEQTEPWYRATLAFDRGRLAQVRAAVEGVPFEPDPLYEMTMAFQAAAAKDGEMMRHFLDMASVLSLADEVMSRPGVFERVIELGAGWRDEQMPGPSRPELLELVGVMS